MSKLPRLLAAILFALVCLSAALEAQIPRARAGYGQSFRKPYNIFQVNQFLASASFYHLVTVDSGGAGDYTDLSDALAFVSAQSPAVDDQWLVLVYPGSTDVNSYSYVEASLTVPNYTRVEGVGSTSGLIGATNGILQGRATVKITAATGVGVTLGTGSSITRLGIHLNGTFEAGYVGLSMGNFSSLADSLVTYGVSGSPNVAATVISTASAANVAIDRSHIDAVWGGTNLLEVVRSTGSGAHLSMMYSVIITPSNAAGIHVETGALASIYYTRVYGGATADLDNDGVLLRADHSTYNTSSGTISRAGIATAKITSGTSLPAACTVPEVFEDTTTAAPRICICTASNTWKCAQTQIKSASAPYTCDAGVAGDEYYDTTTPTPCWCDGSAWQPVVTAANCS